MRTCRNGSEDKPPNGKGRGKPASSKLTTAYPAEYRERDRRQVDLSGFDQAAAVLKELRGRGVKCGIWAMAESPRNLKDAPFCWQHKHALTFIVQMFSESGNDHSRASNAIAAYVAMAHLASDFGSETFTAAKALIAHKAGLSVSTVERLLKDFEQLGIVKIERRAFGGAFKAPNTYTLLTIRHSDVSIRQTVGERFPERADTDKKTKKTNNDQGTGNTEDNSTSNAGSKPSVPSAPEGLEEGYQDQDQPQARKDQIASSAAQNLRQAWGNKPVQQHKKWPEFALYCKRMSGKPTEKGFWTWLSKQKRCWRDRVRSDTDEAGYVLNKKFYGAAEANMMAAANSALRFRQAVRRNGKIIFTDNDSHK